MVRGSLSNRTKGLRRQAIALQNELKRDKARLEGTTPKVIQDPVELRKRAVDLLESHQIKPEPALVETAMDYFRAEAVFNYLAGELECCISGDQAARLGQSLAAQLKLRRAALADLGLPGDPDDRDDFRRPSVIAPKSVVKKAKGGGLDQYMED